MDDAEALPQTLQYFAKIIEFRRKVSFSDNKIHFFDNIIDVLGPRFYCSFMAIAIVFVAIIWQFYGKYNRFCCDFMTKTIDFIAILWRFQGEKKIDFAEIMWR